MDNHAGNINISNNYVAGIVDSIADIRLDRYFPKGKLLIKPSIKFVMTNVESLDCFHRWLDYNKINHYIQTNYVTKGNERKTLLINRYNKCISFIDIICGYCVLKCELLNILREFCLHRVQHVMESGWSFSNTPFDDFEKQIYNKMLNYDIDLFKGYDNNFTLSWFKGYLSNIRIVNKGDGYMITISNESVKNNFIGFFDLNDISHNITTHNSKKPKSFGKGKRRKVFNIMFDKKSFDVVYGAPETNT